VFQFALALITSVGLYLDHGQSIITAGKFARKEMEMGHIVRLQSREQFIAAIGVLNQLPGMWHSRGPEASTELLVLDSHHQALISAGVIAPNGKEGESRGKKTTRKKIKS
jgi:hypothetical protein